ncbi:MAG: hypothetical protein ACKUBY_04500 [Candidatus Moraniibacteriota bacterium]|jgi:hypothetical protein
MKKKIFIISFICVCFVTTSIVVALVCQNGLEYVSMIVVSEQEDHYNKMNKNIIDLQIIQKDFEEYIDILNEKQFSKQEKEDIGVALRDLEEIALNISKQTGFYQEDTTVHMFFSPDYKIIKYFDDTRNTPLFINRFVRSFENGLFENYISKNQKEDITNTFKLLEEEIESL